MQNLGPGRSVVLSVPSVIDLMCATPKINFLKPNFPGPKIGMNEAYIYRISHEKYLSHT